jgi:hypothetical protein
MPATFVGKKPIGAGGAREQIVENVLERYAHHGKEQYN